MTKVTLQNRENSNRPRMSKVNDPNVMSTKRGAIWRVRLGVTRVAFTGHYMASIDRWAWRTDRRRHDAKGNKRRSAIENSEFGHRMLSFHGGIFHIDREDRRNGRLKNPAEWSLTMGAQLDRHDSRTKTRELIIIIIYFSHSSDDVLAIQHRRFDDATGSGNVFKFYIFF